MRAGKGDRPANDETCRARKNDGEDLGHAMDHQPAGKLVAKSLVPEHGIHRSDHHPVIDQQPGGRDAERKAQRKGKQRDLCVVVEEET